jgi:putative membrane protein
MLGAILSALHVLGLGIGLGAIVTRGRALSRVASGDLGAAQAAFAADAFWGLAAILWLASGLLRAFGGIEKSPAFYLDNGFFWIKMALFVSILLLEILPMLTLVRWRFDVRRGDPIDTRRVATLVRINHAETALVVVIPFVAAAMTRGLWLLA